MSEGEKTIGARLTGWSQRNPIVAMLLFVAVVVSALIAVTGWAFETRGWYLNNVRWRDREYEKLNSLHAGYSLSKFEQQLGPPLLTRRDSGGTFTEYTFRRRSHWVQAVVDRDGTVVLYAVTSCSRGFHPRFTLPTGERVELKRTTFSGAAGPDPFSVDLHYFLSGATANNFFMDAKYGANPGNYQTFMWGINDACPDWANENATWYAQNRTPFPIGSLQFVLTGTIGQRATILQTDSLKRFRDSAVVNTYAETAPLVWIPTFSGPQPRGEPPLPLVPFGGARQTEGFMIGVDRINVRITTCDSCDPFVPAPRTPVRPTPARGPSPHTT